MSYQNPGKSIFYFSKISKTSKVLEIKVLESPGVSLWLKLTNGLGPCLGSYLLKQSDNKFQNIWHLICTVMCLGIASLCTVHLVSMLAVDDVA